MYDKHFFKMHQKKTFNSTYYFHQLWNTQFPRYFQGKNVIYSFPKKFLLKCSFPSWAILKTFSCKTQLGLCQDWKVLQLCSTEKIYALPIQYRRAVSPKHRKAITVDKLLVLIHKSLVTFLTCSKVIFCFTKIGCFITIAWTGFAFKTWDLIGRGSVLVSFISREFFLLRVTAGGLYISGKDWAL